MFQHQYCKVSILRHNVFRKILNCLICCLGDVLITVATGFLTDSEGERAGLVPTHAYAVLDIRKIKVLYSYELLIRQFDTVLLFHIFQ